MNNQFIKTITVHGELLRRGNIKGQHSYLLRLQVVSRSNGRGPILVSCLFPSRLSDSAHCDCSSGHNVIVGRNGSGKSNFFSGEKASGHQRRKKEGS